MQNVRPLPRMNTAGSNVCFTAAIEMRSAGGRLRDHSNCMVSQASTLRASPLFVKISLLSPNGVILCHKPIDMLRVSLVDRIRPSARSSSQQ